MRALNCAVAILIFVFFPVVGFAQEHDQHHAGSMEGPAPLIATEPGQGAFAAIAEIVAVLSADAATDWSLVDIDALREHLLDMNYLTLNAAVETEVTETYVQFDVSGQGRTFDAVQAMVPAHAEELALITDWTVRAELTGAGAALRIGSTNESEIAKISALGFFGIMATGGHHQEHHLMIATGLSHH